MAKKKSNAVVTDEAPKADEVVTNENVSDEVISDETVSNENEKTDKAKVEKTKAPKVLKFSKQKDLVNALLDEKKTYSIKEVEDIINKFLYGKK